MCRICEAAAADLPPDLALRVYFRLARPSSTDRQPPQTSLAGFLDEIGMTPRRPDDQSVETPADVRTP